MSSKESPATEEKIVRVYHANRSEGSFQHGEHKLVKGGFADVPESVANLWLKHKSVGVPLVSVQEPTVSSSELKLAEENKALAERNAAAESEAKSLGEKVANLEKLLEELKAGSTTRVPVVQEQSEGELATGQTVVTGDALKEAQAKQSRGKRG